MNAKDEMNVKLYNASVHLIEAARDLKEYSGEFSLKLMMTADAILSVVEAPEEKINKDDMDDILNDILNSKE